MSVIVGLVIIALIALMAFQQFVKSTVIQSVLNVLFAICGIIIAFSFYEPISQRIIAFGRAGAFAAPGIFIILFLVGYSVLRAGADYFFPEPINFSHMPDRVICALSGAVFGYLIAGILLIVAAMLPIPAKYPYPRFDPESPNLDSPKKAWFNPEGAVAGIYKFITNGSLYAGKTFAAVHPDFVDQLYINRLPNSLKDSKKKIPALTGKNSLQIPSDTPAWIAPEGIKNARTNTEIKTELGGKTLTIVRTAFKSGIIQEGGAMAENRTLTFIPAQLRLLHTSKDESADYPGLNTETVYPIGYMKSAGKLETKTKTDLITLQASDFKSYPGLGNVAVLDLAFYVPNGRKPVAVAFKRNGIAAVPKVLPPEQAPAGMAFIQIANCTNSLADLEPPEGLTLKPLQLAAEHQFLLDMDLRISSESAWSELKKTEMDIQTRYADDNDEQFNAISVKAEPTEQKVRVDDERPRNDNYRLRGLSDMFNIPKGYKLISLRCEYTGEIGVALPSDKFPVLVEHGGTEHHAAGILAGGNSPNGPIYQIEYCALTSDQFPGGLVFKNNAVSKPFPDSLWVTEPPVENIIEIYFLYLAKEDKPAGIITGVRVGSTRPATVKKYEGFIID